MLWICKIASHRLHKIFPPNSLALFLPLPLESHFYVARIFLLIQFPPFFDRRDRMFSGPSCIFPCLLVLGFLALPPGSAVGWRRAAVPEVRIVGEFLAPCGGVEQVRRRWTTSLFVRGPIVHLNNHRPSLRSFLRPKAQGES